MISLDHSDKCGVSRRTSDRGFMTKTGFESVSKPHVMVQGVRNGGEEEGDVSPCEEYVELCKRRRKEGRRRRAREIKEGPRLHCLAHVRSIAELYAG
jgi:hypothetical protein